MGIGWKCWRLYLVTSIIAACKAVVTRTILLRYEYDATARAYDFVITSRPTIRLWVWYETVREGWKKEATTKNLNECEWMNEIQWMNDMLIFWFLVECCSMLQRTCSKIVTSSYSIVSYGLSFCSSSIHQPTIALAAL